MSAVIIAFSVIIVVLVVGIIALTTTAVIYSNNDSGNTGGLQPCSQTVNPQDLLVIPAEGDSCSRDGKTGLFFYIGNVPGSTLDFIVAPWGTAPIDVCVEYCTTYNKGVCVGPTYNGKTAQQNFDQCMTQLSSTTCAVPLPIAIKDAVLYYAYSPTDRKCES